MFYYLRNQKRSIPSFPFLLSGSFLKLKFRYFIIISNSISSHLARGRGTLLSRLGRARPTTLPCPVCLFCFLSLYLLLSSRAHVVELVVVVVPAVLC